MFDFSHQFVIFATINENHNDNDNDNENKSYSARWFPQRKTITKTLLSN